MFLESAGGKPHKIGEGVYVLSSLVVVQIVCVFLATRQLSTGESIAFIVGNAFRDHKLTSMLQHLRIMQSQLARNVYSGVLPTLQGQLQNLACGGIVWLSQTLDEIRP